ncbi:FKBP-type peptidyl-prolyl cis-trans isomerase [Serratia sp. UGAL515B_01]|uniref:FKBP-type peptidyl-prolyl cis-trans isomerase n=1 Tax=Serratia sp. UGAL515B_01 TaxID=2986763 RepID=UPI0029548E2D|nr:FKBP-type peptidyl-prolyl cis-trans isomerase [Serratia sp. UGAL515B_01]WON76144.1 FKBP-type peptidyl-prolyl cis-trans isomerase [Serratia sp. UGAL515B_01]
MFGNGDNRHKRILLATVLMLMALPALAVADKDDGIPAILKFVGQWPEKNPATKSRQDGRQFRLAPQNGLHQKKADEATLIELRQQIEALKGQLNARAEELAELRREGAENARRDNAQNKLRRKVAMTSARLAKAVTERNALQNQLKAQSTVLEAMQKNLTDEQQQSEALKSQIASLTRINKNLDRQVTESVSTIATLESQKKETEAKYGRIILDGKNAAAVTDYASGAMFGRELAHALMLNTALGVKYDSKVVLAGVMDVIDNRLQLRGDDIEKAFSGQQDRLRSARDKMLAMQAEKGKDALALLKRHQGVKEAEAGYSYRIDAMGKGKIAEEQPVRVTVKESLADGTVIEDMEKSGLQLNQKLSEFPPIFQAVIRQLQIGGKATVLIPPELAYGEDGYPPKIPPGATMLYEIKVTAQDKGGS